MKIIELEEEQYESLMGLLSEQIALYGHEASVLMQYPEAQKIGMEKLHATLEATKLFSLLSRS